jgi:hypothetical protein
MQYVFTLFALLLTLGAVIAFSLFVVRPLQMRRAVVRARRIIMDGKIDSDWQFRNVYRQLATASDNLEANQLQRQLDEMKATAVKAPERKPIYIAIIAPAPKISRKILG